MKLPKDNAAREALVKPVADHSIFSESMVAFRPEAPPSLDTNVVVAVGVEEEEFLRIGVDDDCGTNRLCSSSMAMNSKASFCSRIASMTITKRRTTSSPRMATSNTGMIPKTQIRTL